MDKILGAMLRKELDNTRQLKKFYEGFHARICLKESARFNRWLLRVLKVQPGIKLLDIACGGGYFLSEASQRGVISYGVEISEKAISIARIQKGKKELLIADAEHLPYEDNIFDMVTCLGSLEHFIHPEAALSEMLRIGKKRACFCILLPNLFSWDNIQMVKKTGRSPSHDQELERFFTRWQWQDFLEENRLKVKRVVKYNGFPNLFERKNGRVKLKSLKKFFRRFFIPFNLSASFIFICERKD